jgi:hypothetical protein
VQTARSGASSISETGIQNDALSGAALRRFRGKDPYVAEYKPDLHLRRLDDGSEYRVVKVVYEPDQLEGLLEADGWRAAIDGTNWFIFGLARPC